MIGRPLSDLLELPFGSDIIVNEIDRIHNGLRFRLADQRSLIDLSSGSTWDCPDDLF